LRTLAGLQPILSLLLQNLSPVFVFRSMGELPLDSESFETKAFSEQNSHFTAATE
jgi:hypothetical protein